MPAVEYVLGFLQKLKFDTQIKRLNRQKPIYMPRQKEQPPTLESVYNYYERLELKDQISLFKLIDQSLQDKKRAAQQVQDQLAQVVKEKN